MTDRDPSGLDAATPGAKLDAGKPMYWDIISSCPINGPGRFAEAVGVKLFDLKHEDWGMEFWSSGIPRRYCRHRLRIMEPADSFGAAVVSIYGAAKYSPGGWVHVEDGVRRFLNAAMRHRVARIIHGEVRDPESGLPHRDHEMCSVLYAARLLEMGHAKTG